MKHDQHFTVCVAVDIFLQDDLLGRIVALDAGSGRPAWESDALDGRRRLRFSREIEEDLERFGHVPLPPYVKRPDDRADRADRRGLEVRVRRVHADLTAAAFGAGIYGETVVPETRAALRAAEAAYDAGETGLTEVLLARRDWLEARLDYEGIPEIQAIDATKPGPLHPAKGTDYLIMDAPASTHGKTINKMLLRVETLILPVLPSPIDIRACRRFLEELLASGRVSRHQTRIGIVANRVRENTRIYHDLERYLGHLKIPFITHLRESQNYIRSAEQGLGIFELAPYMIRRDLEQWDPIISWLNSRRSQPVRR